MGNRKLSAIHKLERFDFELKCKRFLTCQAAYTVKLLKRNRRTKKRLTQVETNVGKPFHPCKELRVANTWKQTPDLRCFSSTDKIYWMDTVVMPKSRGWILTPVQACHQARDTKLKDLQCLHIAFSPSICPHTLNMNNRDKSWAFISPLPVSATQQAGFNKCKPFNLYLLSCLCIDI